MSSLKRSREDENETDAPINKKHKADTEPDKNENKQNTDQNVEKNEKKEDINESNNKDNKDTKESNKDKKEEKNPTAEEIVDEFLTDNPEMKVEDITIDDPRQPEEVLGVVMRQDVHMTREFGEVKLMEFESINCSGAPVIISFPSIGLVGVLTGKQIVKTLDLPLIAVIKLEHFQVACVVSHEQPSYPARVYGNKNIVIFICEVSFHVPPEAMMHLVNCILDFAHRHRSPIIYALEGMPKPHVVKLPTGEEVEIRLENISADGTEGEAEEEERASMVIDDSRLAKITVRERMKQKSNEIQTDDDKEQKQQKPKTTKNTKKKKRRRRTNPNEEEEEPMSKMSKLADKLFGDKIHYVTTSLTLAKKLRSLGHVPVVDGIIPGVAGGLLAEATLKTRIDVAVILAPTSTLFPDPDSAVRVLKLLNDLQPSSEMNKTAEELEKDVASLRKMMNGIMKTLSSDIRSHSLRRSGGGGVPLGMYQ